MNDTVNSDGNLFGRFVALILIVGVAFAAHRMACGSACFMKFACCPVVTAPAPVEPAVEPVPEPVETPKAKPKARKPVAKPLPLETALPHQTPVE